MTIKRPSIKKLEASKKRMARIKILAKANSIAHSKRVRAEAAESKRVNKREFWDRLKAKATGEHVFNGKGHYGEQVGGLKSVMQPVPDNQPHDSLQAELWDNHILVEVERLGTSPATGGLAALIVGREPHVQAAIDYCRNRTPQIEVLLSPINSQG